MTKNRVRGFEKVSTYKDRDINLPVRKTEFSGGYDFESAETIAIPSVWSQVMNFFNKVENEGCEAYEEIMKFVNRELTTKSLKDFIKEHNLRPTLVPTGIKAFMLDDEYLEISNRSSGALNRGLIMSNGIGKIDSDYYGVDGAEDEGHIYFQFLNFLPFDITIQKSEAIGQGSFLKYLLTDDDGDNFKETRMGGMGSTDKQ